MSRLCTYVFMLVILASASQAQSITAFTNDGSGSGVHLGWSVSGAGDVNGDGYDDVITSAPLESTAGVPTGRVRVYSGLDGSLLHVFSGDGAFDGFGCFVSGAGDVNADGFADLIVGAYGDDNNGMTSGSARVFSGLDGAVLYSLDGDAANDHFGYSVGGAGDLNGDGHADFIVGAFCDDNNGLDSGSARVFSGVDGSTLFTFDGDGVNDRFGYSVSAAGDVNADGIPDLVVGAIYDDNNGIDSGSARVFSGLDGSILYTFFGDGSDDQFGFSVSGAGDVDGDGHADIVVGARLDDDNGSNSGSARVFSGADGSILYTFRGDSANDFFGASVSGAGDVNGDGFADIVVGARFDDDNGADSGSVRIFSGLDGSVLDNLHGDGAGDYFGYAVNAAGDVNGDGFADVVVGAPFDDNGGSDSGSVRVFTSPDLPTLKYRTTTGATHFLDLSWVPENGDPQAPIGDLVCSGATPAGLGLVAASLGSADDVYFGFLPVLIDVNPASVLLNEGFGFDLGGSVLVAHVSRQNPALAGMKVYVQFFETAPIVSSSPAIRIEATL